MKLAIPLSLALLCAFALWWFDPAHQAERAARADLAIARAALQAEQDAALAPLWTVALGVLIVALSGALVWVVLAHAHLIVARANARAAEAAARARLVRPDARGCLPLDSADPRYMAVATRMALESHRTRQIAAGAPAVVEANGVE